MENGIAQGGYTGIDKGLFDGDYTGTNGGLANGIYNENRIYQESINGQIVRNGLVLNLDAGNRASYVGSGTAWTDLSGNGNNGTLTNGPTFNSGNGGSIVFDGSNDYVAVTGSITTSTATFITWIYRNGNQPDYAGLLFGRGATANGTNFNSASGGLGNIIGYHWGSTNAFSWNSGLIPPNLAWCMCAVSVGSTSAVAYLCQSTGITSATNVLNHTSVTISGINIGIDSAISSRVFRGNVAIAQIYNRDLSPTEIGQNFNATKSRFGL